MKYPSKFDWIAITFFCILFLGLFRHMVQKAEAASVVYQCVPSQIAGDIVAVGMQSATCNKQGAVVVTAVVQVTRVTATDNKVYRFVENLGPTSDGNARMVEAGTATVDTHCDATQSIRIGPDTYFRVPRKSVTWAGNNRPATAWGKCLGDLPTQ